MNRRISKKDLTNLLCVLGYRLVGGAKHDKWKHENGHSVVLPRTRGDCRPMFQRLYKEIQQKQI